MSIAILPNKFFLEKCRPDYSETPFYGVLETATDVENANIVLKEVSQVAREVVSGVQHDAWSNKYAPVHNVRSVKTWQLDIEKSLTSNILRGVVADMNKMFNYNISNILEILYCEYRVGDYYKMHVDVGEDVNACRKISITWNLNPHEYKGGELAFYQPNLPEGVVTYKSPSTNIIGFSSFLNHEVKPVTQGTRKAIVAFIGGEAWR